MQLMLREFGTAALDLDGPSFEELLPLYEPVVTVSDDGPWVFRIPPELFTRVAALDDAGVADVARQWAATEEFVLDCRIAIRTTPQAARSRLGGPRK